MLIRNKVLYFVRHAARLFIPHCSAFHLRHSGTPNSQSTFYGIIIKTYIPDKQPKPPEGKSPPAALLHFYKYVPLRKLLKLKLLDLAEPAVEGSDITSYGVHIHTLC